MQCGWKCREPHTDCSRSCTSKFKLVRSFPERPVARLEVEETERVNFDEALMPDDSWEVNLAGEGILDGQH